MVETYMRAKFMRAVARRLGGLSEARRAPRLALAAFLALIAWLSPAATAKNANTLPADFILQHVIGLPDLITSVAFSPDGRMFIGTKTGVIHVFVNGQLMAEPFADLTSEVNSYLDRGLMGLAVHPQFPAQPYVYVYYAYDPPGVEPDGGGARVARVLRLQAEPGNLNKASTAPETRVSIVGSNSTRANIGDEYDIYNLDAESCRKDGAYLRDCISNDSNVHIGGKLAFAPDGSLLVSVGDASLYVVADQRALRTLNPDSLNGKVLRVNPLTGAGYADNPFFNGDPTANRSKVVYSGLRNPFRFAVQPVSGVPYVGDVGWNAWEELNAGPPGSNFGWPCFEGGTGGSQQQSAFAADPAAASVCAAYYAHTPVSVTAPLYAYDHSDDEGAAVLAGAFYSATAYPAAYRGALFLLDYSRRWIKTATVLPSGALMVSEFGRLEGAPVDMTTGLNGDLFIAVVEPDFGGASVYRLRYKSGTGGLPVAVAKATPAYGAAPLNVQFSSDGSFDPDLRPLGFFWDLGDGAVATAPNPTHTYATSGTFTATLTVVNQFGDTNAAQVVVRPGVLPPLLTVTEPLTGTRYATGDDIVFAAVANGRDGTNLDGRIVWSGYLHHNEHIHYDFFTHAGPTTTLTVPDHGDNTWMEACARVQDDAGLEARTCVSLLPRTVEYRFDTSPSGLTVQFDGISRLAPYTATTVVGGLRDVSVAPQQGCYSFERWWDGSTALSREVIALSSNQVLSATFRNTMCGHFGPTLYLPLLSAR